MTKKWLLACGFLCNSTYLSAQTQLLSPPLALGQNSIERYVKQVNQDIPLSSSEIAAWHRCEKTFDYDVYLAGAHVGTFHRVIHWENTAKGLSAKVESIGLISVLWLDSTYNQTSFMHWLPEKQHFITPNFTQKITGLRARDMYAVMSELGHKSTVVLDGEQSEYQNAAGPLYDIDTLGAQIRVNLLQGNTSFVLFRQATDQVKKYDFEVVGTQVVKDKKWGEITTLKIKEVGDYSKMVLWFAPSLDYQLIQAQLDAFVSPKVYLSNYSQQCSKDNQ